MASPRVPSTIILRDYLDNPRCDTASRRFDSRYRPRVMAICQSLGLQHADAEEVTASVLLEFFRQTMEHRFVYLGRDRLNAWLGRVARRTAYDLFHDRQRQLGAGRVGDDGLLEQFAARLERICDDDLEMGRQVVAAVQERIEPHTWQAFELTELDGLRAAEVAARLGMTLQAVWQARHRVGTMLQEERRRRYGDDTCNP